MSLVGPWLVFPLVLTLLCLGTGLLVERLGGRRLPTVLLAPLGFCGLVATLMLVTTITPLAPASTWVALVLALAGLVVGRRRVREMRPDRWTVGLPVVVYGLFAATAVLTFERTFLGYTSLGDASFNLMLAERIVDHGRTLEGVSPSTYQIVLANYLGTSYPVGGHVVLGAASKLTFLDVAWTYQPFLAGLAALLSLALVPVAREVLGRRSAVLAAGVTAGGGMTFAYAVLQQAIKELAVLVALVTLVALVRPLVRRRPAPAAAIPAAVATTAALGILSVAILPWIGPLLLVAVAVLVRRWWRPARGPLLAQVAVFVVVGLVLAIPTLRLLTVFVEVTSTSLTAASAGGAGELGNLAKPVSFGNVLGVWPVADYRFGEDPSGWAAIALVGVAVALVLLGFGEVVRRRSWTVLLFAGVSALGFALVVGRASPWAYGKALLLLSPALVLIACVGVSYVWRVRRVEAVVLGLALLLGVGWTDANSYRVADPAPFDRLGELERLGEAYAGQGPVTTFEFEEYGKYFLRRLDPNTLSEGVNRGDVALAPGRTVRFGVSSEPDDWSAADLSRYPLLIVRRGPIQSRPPSNYRRVERGRFYSVWRRDDDAPVPAEHVPLGGRFDASSQPECSTLRDLASRADAAGADIAVAPRPAVAALDVTAGRIPEDWGVDGTDPAVLRPVGQGLVRGTVEVPAAARYAIWAEGSYGRAATISVDGQEAARVDPALSPRRGARRVATLDLAAGSHAVSLLVGGGTLAPGNNGTLRFVGPVLLTPDADVDAGPVERLAPRQYRRACGRSLDWMEIVPR